MYEYHDQYKRARDRKDVEAQARWARQLTWEVARHAVGEEIVVYPLMEKYLGQRGLDLANHDREGHLVRDYFFPRSLSNSNLIQHCSASEGRPLQAGRPETRFPRIRQVDH